MSNTRNRSLFNVPEMAKAIEHKKAVGSGPRTSDEEFARQMTKGVVRAANLLAVCPECWDDLQLVDGQWVCFSCKQEPPLDVTAEDYRQ